MWRMYSCKILCYYRISLCYLNLNLKVIIWRIQAYGVWHPVVGYRSMNISDAAVTIIFKIEVIIIPFNLFNCAPVKGINTHENEKNVNVFSFLFQPTVHNIYILFYNHSYMFWCIRVFLREFHSFTLLKLGRFYIIKIH